MKIGIIAKPNIEEPLDITQKLSIWLKDRGVEVFVEKDLGDQIDHPNSVDRADIPKLVDVILVFGGDGTFLGVARLACKYGTPILGINLGGLGFLTEVTVEELYPMMERIIEGNYEVEERQMLRTSLHRGENIIETHEVLNDIVINKGAVARIIDLAIHIEDSHVTTYRADEIIHSTTCR